MKRAPDVSPILQTAFFFWSSKVLLTAVGFGLFTRLGRSRLTGAGSGGPRRKDRRNRRAVWS